MRKLVLLLICAAWAFSAPAGNISPVLPARAVTSYALTLVPDFAWYNPSAWRLLASNDGQAWTVLDIRTNQYLETMAAGFHPTSGQRRVYQIDNQTTYRIYRLQIDRNVLGTANQVALAEVELLGPVTGVAREGDLQARITASQEHPLLGEALNAFDGDGGTRWLDYGPFKDGGCWIQCEYVPQTELVITNVNQVRLANLVSSTRVLLAQNADQIQSNLAASATQMARILTGYALTSANDYGRRDPHDWQLLGSNDGGQTWTVVDTRQNEIFSSRFQRRVFTLSRPARFGIYRLQFKLKEANGFIQQLGGLEPLYSDPQDNGCYSLAILASAENPPMEKAEMAFDDDPRSKWLCFVDNIDQPVWIQWQCVPAVEGLPLINLRQLKLLTDRSQAAGNVPAPGNLSRTLASYSLTSAGDAPERDPRDWRLLGSHDGGRTWETLDERHQEVFPQRIQQRSFTVSKPNAYSLYRLQFDAVADSAKANSIHLAEIEPVYAGESTPSSLCTVVSAHGENPPNERMENLFDGDPNTKWLDFSSSSHRESWVQWSFASQKTNPVVRADSLPGIQPILPHVFQLQMEGVVACCGSNILGFLDQSGFQMFRTAGRVPPIQPGARVCLTGQLQFGDGFPLVKNPSLEVVGVLTNLGKIQPETPFDHHLSFASGFADGLVTSANEEPSGLTLHLAPDGGSHNVRVKILNPDHRPFPILNGHRFRFRGVIEPVYDEQGVQFPGLVWVPGLADTSLAPLLDGEWANLRRAASQPGYPKRISPGQFAYARGVVLRQEVGRQLVIRQGTNQLAVNSSQIEQIPVGSAVEAAGFLFQTGATPGLQLSYFRALPASVVTNTIQTNSPNEPADRPVTAFPGELTSLGQIAAAVRDEPDRTFHVKVHGVITYIDLGLTDWYLQEGADSARVNGMLPAGLSPSLQLEGMYVELQGTVGGPDGINISPSDYVKILGKGAMPTPLRHSLEYLMTGNDVGKWVQLDGVVTAVEKQRLTLLVHGGPVIVWVNETDHGAQERLFGSEVSVSGLFAPAINNRGQLLGPRMLVPSPEFVRVLRGNPENFFGAPSRPISTLMQFGAAQLDGSAQQDLISKIVKISGIVTYQEPGVLFVQKDKYAVRVFTRQDTSVVPGDTVDVVGFEDMDGLSPKLVQALVRKNGHAPLPSAVPINLLGSDSDKEEASQDATLGTAEALLLRRSFNESSQILELKQEKTEKTFFAYLPVKTDVLNSVPLGSRVRLTGAFKAHTDSVPDSDQMITSFEMYLNSPDDITVLSRPPWWTAQHTLWVLGGLGTVLFVVLAWVGLLRNQVRRRTRELQVEITERKRMEIEVEKTHSQLLAISRQAGMAEVATSVLHNVGNVLNSVNVSSGLVASHVRNSGGAKLAKVVALMNEHSADLAEFITRDARGRQIPVYLAELAKHQDHESMSALKEMEGLKLNIEHIKEIVAMQQNYARLAGVTEVISVIELVEEALRINAVSLRRHQVRVLRDFDPDITKISVDRHKVLQILVNVISNAKYACEVTDRKDRQIKVRVGRHETWVEISIADNGVGIAPENMTKIFSHGFTTRKDGHGFGLHNSALAARELGGALAAHSDGPGQGAIFTLQLPILAQSG